MSKQLSELNAEHRKQLVLQLSRERQNGATFRSTNQTMKTSSLSNHGVQGNGSVSTGFMGASASGDFSQSFLTTLEMNLQMQYKNGMQVCLTCLEHGCGRFEKQHSLNHYNQV